eukprot:TRINITY_DN15751_c0_g1_i1.p1 TRINITY_DN15751_c0_g1~~TRINITY_DN15751_c0_g1_i1.p1  ORF type:complete len:405 (+),score=54.92 TRINITY_DN15751_c0_g1_i1:146-1360(+)
MCIRDRVSTPSGLMAITRSWRSTLRIPALLLTLLVANHAPCLGSAPSPAPVSLIIDTDLATDVSNLISVCMINALVDLGEVDLLAVMVSVGQPTAIGAISSVNHYHGHDDVLLGSYKGPIGKDYPGLYVDDLIATFPGPIRNYSQVLDGFVLYRKVLSEQPDHSVSIAAHGFLTNLHLLLLSPPDQYSPLSGDDLFALKVKQVVMMGGVYPQSSPTLGEWNFAGSPASTAYVLEHWPGTVPIVFSGFELGVRVLTGSGLRTGVNCLSGNKSLNPCALALYDQDKSQPSLTHPSWDSVTSLYAVRGASEQGWYSFVTNGHNTANATDGANAWMAPATGLQSYMVLNESFGVGPIEETIDGLLCALPSTPPVSAMGRQGAEQPEKHVRHDSFFGWVTRVAAWLQLV